MTTLNPGKTLRAPLLLLAAISIVHIGSATAADVAGDAEAQARSILSQARAGGPTAARSHTGPERAATLHALDPQEQAREVVLGTQRIGGEAEVAAAPHSEATAPARVGGLGDRRSRADAQEMARRVVLGKSA